MAYGEVNVNASALTDTTLTQEGIPADAKAVGEQKLSTSGGTMTGPINFTNPGTGGVNGWISGTSKDSVNGPGGDLNNVVINSWYGVSFTSGCPNQTYTDKTAVGIDCREGIVKAVDFQGKWNGMIRRLSHNTSDTWIPVFSEENMDYVLKNEIAGCAYPVGSIYMTVGADPASIFGGTWTLVAGERVLMGAGGGHSAGAYIDAGLPNITGKINNIWSWGGVYTEGALYSGWESEDKSMQGAQITGTKYNFRQRDVNFAASNSNVLYGRSGTVQPAAYYVNIWQRIS